MCLRSQDRNRSSLRMEFSTLALHMSTSAHEESVIFTGRGAPENWGDQVPIFRSKGGIKRFFQIKKGDHLYFLKK